jgi:hypothetical protein
LIALLLAITLAAGGAVLVFRWYAGAEFPGAIMTSDRSVFYPGTHPVLRRDTTYITSAPFNEVYTWYSITYELGPEQYGQGTCILMARSRSRLGVVDEDIGVTVCDTPSGRTILVTRSIALRVR